MRLPDRGQRPAVVEQGEPPRSLSPPPGAIQLRGKGWTANVPMVLVTALLSAVGARLLPTATSTDQSIERAQVAAERRALEDERFRSEVRAELGAIRQQLEKRSDELGNRMLLLEERLKARP